MNEGKINKKTMGILAGLLLTSCLCIFYKYLFGSQVLAFTDIGSDTYDQYLMLYQTVINHLREGSFSLWDFNNGFGINMFSMNLFDPFLILLYLFGTIFGPSSIYGMLVYLQILRIILAGLSGYGFLSCFSLSERSKLLAAYAYALCGYMVVWGQHYQFGTVLIMFPLLLIAAEKAVKKSGWLLGLTLFCAMDSIISLYMSYMQFIVLGFYVLFRSAWNGKFFTVENIKRIGKIYGSMILGIGMGLFSLLPGAAMIFGSGRVGGSPLFQRILENLRPWNLPYYKTLFKRFFSGNLEGINVYRGAGNYYEDTNVFLSALLIFCGAQFIYFLFRKKYAIRQRIVILLAAGLFGVMLLLPVGSLIFNGFAYPFSRHTYLCMPFFVWMMASSLDEMLERKNICIPVWMLTFLGVCAVYLYCLRDCRIAGESSAMKLAMILAIFAAVMAVCLVIPVRHSKAAVHRAASGGLILSLMGTMILDGYYSYNVQRSTLSKAPSEYMDEMYSPSVAAALDEIAAEDDSFYRVEKDYTVGSATSCLNSLAQNYAGVSTYNSSMNTGSIRFVQEFWPNLEIVNAAHYSFANAVNDDFQASLNHVKYVLSKKTDFQVRGYEPYRQIGDICVYRNTHTQELGKFYTSAFTAADYEAVKESVNQEALLAENVICDTVPEMNRNSEELSEYRKNIVAQDEEIVRESDDGTSIILKIPQAEEVSDVRYTMEFDMSLPQMTPEVQITAGAHTTELLIGPEPVHVQVTVPEGCKEVRISHPHEVMNGTAVIQNKKLYSGEAENLSSLSEGIQIEACRKDSVVQGTANVKKDGILMLAIPYENGWHAYVDGKEVPVHRVNYGFSGIRLTAGEHKVLMKYRCPGFLPGVVGSFCFAALTAGIWGRLRMRKSRKDLSKKV